MDPRYLAGEVVINSKSARIGPCVASNPFESGNEGTSKCKHEVIVAIMRVAEHACSHEIRMDLSGNVSLYGNAAIRIRHFPCTVQAQSWGLCFVKKWRTFERRHRPESRRSHEYSSVFWMGLGAFVLGGSFVCRWRSVGFLVSSVLELLREGKEGDGKKEGEREGIRQQRK